jgi:beta-glucosidase
MIPCSDISLSKNEMAPSDKLQVKIRVTNAGNYDGEETVQLYIRDMVSTITQPVKELKAFQKVWLKKGESKEVIFTLSIEDLKFYDSFLNLVYEPGAFKVFIGGNSRDVKEAGFTLTK